MVRTHMGYHDNSYGCVFQQEDDKGNVGPLFGHQTHGSCLGHLQPDCCNTVVGLIELVQLSDVSLLPVLQADLSVLRLHAVCCAPAARHGPSLLTRVSGATMPCTRSRSMAGQLSQDARPILVLAGPCLEHLLTSPHRPATHSLPVQVGVLLSKQLMAIAGHALKANITTLAPLVLPVSEMVIFVAVLFARKVRCLGDLPCLHVDPPCCLARSWPPCRCLLAGARHLAGCPVRPAHCLAVWAAACCPFLCCALSPHNAAQETDPLHP